jgi:branched-subunit amino acid aminotransferase/4-amino-4-deoxychorismate lyase
LEQTKSLHWYNGKLIDTGRLELSIDDPGLLYGATVFTTLRVYQRSLTHPLTGWQLHCDRLHQSVQILGWQFPDWRQVQAGVEALIPSFPVLRVTLFPDGREWITGRALPDQLTRWQQDGITAWAAPTQFQRSLVSHKTGNYLSSWLARQAAQQQGAQEAILQDEAGNWLETSTGNLWGWRDGCWWTPPLAAGILPGIARSQLISWLKWQNKSIRAEPWCAELVSEFEAIAYSNSVVQLVPIHTVLLATKVLTYNAKHDEWQQLCELFQLESHSIPNLRYIS